MKRTTIGVLVCFMLCLTGTGCGDDNDTNDGNGLETDDRDPEDGDGRDTDRDPGDGDGRDTDREDDTLVERDTIFDGEEETDEDTAPSYVTDVPAPETPCTADPCRNGGACTESAGSYFCQCAEGYYGRICEYPRSSCRALSESGTVYIHEDTTLAAGCYISNDMEVSKTLTLEPGAWLVVKEGASLRIGEPGYDGGTIIAEGTAARPIGFTGLRPERGYWKGVSVNHDTPAHVFSNVIIEYGEYNLGITFKEESSARVSHSTFRQSAGYGVHIGGSNLANFESNRLIENALGAADVSANAVGFLDPGSTYSGNDRDVIHVNGASVSAEQTWPKLDADYLIDEGKTWVHAPLTLRRNGRVARPVVFVAALQSENRKGQQCPNESLPVFHRYRVFSFSQLLNCLGVPWKRPKENLMMTISAKARRVPTCVTLG